MSDDREQLRKIAENEAWLSQNLPAEPPSSLEHLKLRVRVELGEQWLRSQLPQLDEPVSQGLRDRVRDRVLESAGVGQVQVGSRKRQWLVAAGMSLAAMILLGILVVRNARVIDSPQAEEFDEFVFEEEGEDVDWELSLLDHELAELGEGFALLDEPDWDDEFGLGSESDSDF